AWRVAALVKPAAHRLALFVGAFARSSAQTVARGSRGAAAGECCGSSATDGKSHRHDPVDAGVSGRRATRTRSLFGRAGSGPAECARRAIFDRVGARHPVTPGWHMPGDASGAGTAAAAGLTLLDCDHDGSATVGREGYAATRGRPGGRGAASRGRVPF